MAAIDELINQVEDQELRERLLSESKRMVKDKKFGLVFENHLPELFPIFNAKVKTDDKVARRNASTLELWYVQSITNGIAYCRNVDSGEYEQIPIGDLAVVRQFGEPIFPTLVPVDRVQNALNSKIWHILIEAENFHALQLLEYIYAGVVDCIYIDPPYNTGDRKWKYNNNYVDLTDAWRHSKWLSMMKRRLTIAKKVLNPETGVLIVTIDEHEMHHLRVLLNEIFPDFYIQMITAVTNPKGVTQGRFSRVEEYVIFCFGPQATISDSEDDLLTVKPPTKKPRWKGLLRSGTNAKREDRKNMFYPVLIDPKISKVVGVGNILPFEIDPEIGKHIDGFHVAWPIRSDGSLGNWGVGREKLRELISQGYVSCGQFDDKRKTFAIKYISKPNQKKIENGEIVVVGRDSVTNVVSIEYANLRNRAIKTVWHRTRHDAGAHGSDVLKKILPNANFPFPKSIYSVMDAVSAVVQHNKNAVVLDFFAGSGTTLNSVNLINLKDGGSRRCIMVTNNEVSDKEAKVLESQGYCRGQNEWEQVGICRSVTWPRSKFTILGKRDDGSELVGEYDLGRMVEKSRPRKFHHLGFTSLENLKTANKKKQLTSLVDKIPQSAVKADTVFVASEEYPATILFDDSQGRAWLESIQNQDHISDFYIVTNKKLIYDDLKKKVQNLLGESIVEEVGTEKYPMANGFSANLEYFRLEFLDNDQVTLGRNFREILPMLWLKAGAVGTRPELPDTEDYPAMMILEQNYFAVLIDENHFADFYEEIIARKNLTYVFLISDSEEAFQEMTQELPVPNVIHLYKDYLDNFVLNTGKSAR